MDINSDFTSSAFFIGLSLYVKDILVAEQLLYPEGWHIAIRSFEDYDHRILYDIGEASL